MTRFNKVTRQELWFNHAHLFHPSDLPVGTQDALRRMYGDAVELYPKHCTFSDGSPIPVKYLAAVRRAQQESSV